MTQLQLASPAELQARIRQLETEKEELRTENQELRTNLANRKLAERAKGVLMKRHHLSEKEAWKTIQRTACDRRVPIPQICQRIIEGAHITFSELTARDLREDGVVAEEPAG